MLTVMLLSSCSQHAEIDWIDFIKWEDKEYHGVYNGFISDDSYIGKRIGVTKFKVSDSITKTNYKTKHGDAAFLPEGTVLYEVKDTPGFIAVKDKFEINGYKLYVLYNSEHDRFSFKHVPLDKVTKIETYAINPQNYVDRILLHTFSGKEEIKNISYLLVNSKKKSNYQPNMNDGDPIMYEMTFYTHGPIAYKFTIHFDKVHYYFHPYDTNLINDAIAVFLK